jgi:hypothetical protein
VNNLKWNITNRIGGGEWQPNMLAKLTSFTGRGMLGVRSEGEAGEVQLESVTSWMPQSLMPKLDVWSGDQASLWRGGCQRVQLATALTSEELRAGGKILNGETKRVKFHTNVIIAG